MCEQLQTWRRCETLRIYLAKLAARIRFGVSYTQNALIMEAVRTYETFFYSKGTTRCHIPEGSNLITRRHHNLKYQVVKFPSQTGWQAELQSKASLFYIGAIFRMRSNSDFMLSLLTDDRIPEQMCGIIVQRPR